MRNRLLLVIALATLGATVGASVVNAASGDGVIGVGESGVSINLPGGTDLPDVGGGVLPACSNLADDDGDGAVDLGDPGCSGPTDGDEYNAPPPTPEPAPVPDPDAPGGSGGGGGGPITGQIGPGGSGQPSEGTIDEPTSGGGTGGTTAPGDEGGDGNGNGGIEPPPVRQPDGTPTRANPSVTIADFGPTPIGVPNFMIDSFEIPPFLLPIYQACGTEYGIPWQVLAAINKVETAFGTNLNVSTAGAMGWMQFIPSSWEAYGVDANNDGRKDPYNPVDAICAAARYLKAAGGQDDLRTAIFAYNHADWYVDMIMTAANQYGRLPDDLVGSLTGLTEGAHFPIAARSRYADDISERAAARRASGGGGVGNVADVVSSSPTRRGINIYSRDGAPVVAVNDGVIQEVGRDPEMGRYIILEDVYGNTFTYAELGQISKVYPVPEQRPLTAEDFELSSPDGDEAPEQSATGGGGGEDAEETPAPDPTTEDGVTNTENDRERIYALPERPRNVENASLSGQLDSLLGENLPGYETFKAYLGGVLEFNSEDMDLQPLEKGSEVVAGTVLGRVGQTTELAPHINFAIRPTGRGAPRIDPKPILDGWKLLESTAIYRATGQNPFTFNEGATVSQILLMSKTQLERRVLADPRLELYECGREDVLTHQIDRRTLAVMEYLAESGFRLTVTSLKCGHSYYTSAGGVSAHSSGNAVDIAAVNGIPILGHQGSGSITEAVISQLLRLQGTMAPAQVISLMNMGGPSFALSDHHDHIHVGYTPGATPSEETEQFVQLLKPDQWLRLVERLTEIDNPEVPTEPSDASLPAGDGRRGGSEAHVGD